MENFKGQNLQILRTMRGYTRRQLGDMIGVTGHAVYKWEKEGYTPRDDNLLKLTDALKCSADDLYSEVPPIENHEDMMSSLEARFNDLIHGDYRDVNIALRIAQYLNPIIETDKDEEVEANPLGTMMEGK